jgi:hypothetical protein
MGKNFLNNLIDQISPCVSTALCPIERNFPLPSSYIKIDPGSGLPFQVDHFARVDNIFICGAIFASK